MCGRLDIRSYGCQEIMVERDMPKSILPEQKGLRHGIEADKDAEIETETTRESNNG